MLPIERVHEAEKVKRTLRTLTDASLYHLTESTENEYWGAQRVLNDARVVYKNISYFRKFLSDERCRREGGVPTVSPRKRDKGYEWFSFLRWLYSDQPMRTRYKLWTEERQETFITELMITFPLKADGTIASRRLEPLKTKQVMAEGWWLNKDKSCVVTTSLRLAHELCRRGGTLKSLRFSGNKLKYSGKWGNPFRTEPRRRENAFLIGFRLGGGVELPPLLGGSRVKKSVSRKEVPVLGGRDPGETRPSLESFSEQEVRSPSWGEPRVT